MICRIEKLQSEELAILKYASIIGQAFEIEVLLQFLPKKLTRETERCLGNILDHGLIHKVDSNTYSFHHEIIRMFVYKLSPVSKSVEIHLQIAWVIETLYHNSIDHYFMRLSEHYGAGNMHELAFEYSLKALNKSLAHSDFEKGLKIAETCFKFMRFKNDLRVLKESTNKAISQQKTNIKYIFRELNKIRTKVSSELTTEYDHFYDLLTSADQDLTLQ